jgi:hypothetical protein
MSNMRTFEYFIGTMVDPGEDYPADEKPVIQVSDFKNIFN